MRPGSAMESDYIVVSKRQYLRPYPPLFSMKQGESVMGLSTLVGRTSGVEEQENIIILKEGDVRVTEDNHARFREAPC